MLVPLALLAPLILAGAPLEGEASDPEVGLEGSGDAEAVVLFAPLDGEAPVQGTLDRSTRDAAARSFRGRITAGWILVGVGVTSTLLSTATLLSRQTRRENCPTCPLRSSDAYASAAIAVGAVLVAVGLPLAATGHRKRRDAVEASRSPRLSLAPVFPGRGLGLGLLGVF
ncbi:MAG: hypothetical protein R3B09_07115 [Nannocystaceae bacterium]